MSDWDDERVARLEAIEGLRGLAVQLQLEGAWRWEQARRVEHGVGSAAMDRWLAERAYWRARAVVYALQELERLERAVLEFDGWLADRARQDMVSLAELFDD